MPNTTRPNTTLLYNKIPEGIPIAGETLKRVQDNGYNPETVDLKGGVLVQSKALSLDPYQRGRLRDPSIPSYAPAYEVGKAFRGYAVGVVLRSDSAKFQPGQILSGSWDFSEYVVLTEEEASATIVLENKEKLPFTTLVGAVGMSGKTAYWSFYTIGQPQKGEAIFISAAAGAVGQIVGQLAKRESLKVIGSAGSDDKVKFLKEELGFDVAFNYKKESTAEILKEHPFDIYFDNVGGETLDLALENIRPFGRIIACGAVSQYNLLPEERYGVKNTFLVVGKQLTYRGFIISGKDLGNFFTEVPKWVASGEIKIREHVTKGIDNGEAFVAMLAGDASGKAVISLE